MSGDNQCVIRLLEGRARTENQLAMLIAAYRARGQPQQARRYMQLYVNRFAGGRHASGYRRILAAQN